MNRTAVEVQAATPRDMRALGARLAALVRPGDLLVLAGPLGAGKTVLVAGLAAGLGVAGPVTSPTFVLAREHAGGRLPLVHVDAYRLGGVAEVDDLDLDSSLDESVTVVEWGAGLVEGLSEAHLRVEIGRPTDGEVRPVRLVPVGGDWPRRLATLDRVVAAGALLLDLDGVLADSAGVVERHWRHFAAAHGLDPAAVLDVAHGRRSADVIALVAPHLDPAVENPRFEELEATDNAGLVALPGAAALAAALPPDRWAVVTSGSVPVATARLRAAGVAVPGVLVTADDVRAGKPDPQGYELAATRLGQPPRHCLAVEDAPAGVAAARSAGARVVATLTTHPAADLAAADLVVADLAAVHLVACTPDGLVLALDPAP